MNARTLLTLAAVGILALLSWDRLAAEDEGSKGLKTEVQALRRAILRLGTEIHDLRWDARSEAISSWKAGTYFIAYPKVGNGGTDADARKVGGTWGTP